MKLFDQSEYWVLVTGPYNRTSSVPSANNNFPFRCVVTLFCRKTDMSIIGQIGINREEIVLISIVE